MSSSQMKDQSMSSMSIQEGMNKTKAIELMNSSLMEREELFELYKTVMAEKALLTEEDASDDEDSIYCCLLEERSLSKTDLVEEIFIKLKEKATVHVTLKSVDHKLLLLGDRRVYGIDHRESEVQEDTNPDCLWCWETQDISHLPEMHRASIIVRRSVRANIHNRIKALSGTIDALTTRTDPDILELEYKLSKIPNKAKIVMMYESNKKRMAEKALKQELRKKKLEEGSERRALEKESLLADKERKRLQKEVEKKLARFDEKKKKHCEKTMKRRLKIEEELAKLNREAIEEEERIEKEKEEMRTKLEAENEVKFSKWLKERFTPSDPVRSTPSTPAQSQEYIDLYEEETSPIASPPCVSIERENLLIEAPHPQGPQAPYEVAREGDQNDV